MSRSGYSYDHDQWDLIRWRGAVASAFRGARGQAFLREALETLDALPEKRLLYGFEVREGCSCLLGSVALRRGMSPAEINPLDDLAEYDREQVAELFGLADAMTAEIMFMNDEGTVRSETPEERFQRMRAWVVSKIQAPPPPPPGAPQ